MMGARVRQLADAGSEGARGLMSILGEPLEAACPRLPGVPGGR
jgi:hypothetical protein